MDDFLRALLTYLAIIGIMVIILMFLPGWFNSINAHEMTIVGGV